MRKAALAVVLALLASACHREPPAERSSIVLITLGNLRPDAIGALGGEAGSTPHLDRWIGEADWAGTAIASSSAQLVSLTSLMTGTSPWQHQVLTNAADTPRPGLSLLAEALGRMGYATTAFVPTNRRFLGHGLLAGFEHVRAIDARQEIRDELGAPAAEPRFVWIHLPEISLPGGARLFPYADPSVPMPEPLRAATWTRYLRAVSRVDDRLGELLDLLRSSERGRRAWVVLTAAHGTELGEHDQVLYAQNLGRAAIEVPLVIARPAGSRPLAVAETRRVGQDRVWATLVEAAGGSAPPVHAPSLFRAAEPPSLSELYLRNGVSVFSLVEQDLQAIWSARFAPEEPNFYRVSASRTAAGRGLRRRLESRFARARPLRGTGPAAPQLALVRWQTGAGSVPATDPAAAQTMASALHLRWLRFAGRERTPEDEARRYR